VITSTVPPRTDPPEAVVRRKRRGPSRPLATWAAVIVLAFAAGFALRSAGVLPHDPMAPLHARPRLLTAGLLPATGIAVFLVVMWPLAAYRLGWRSLLCAGWLAAMGWTVALAASDGGLEALGRPLTHPTEYLGGVAAVGSDPISWLAGFTTRLPQFPTHVEGHPPLPVLILWALERVGLGGPLWAGVVIVAAGGSATAAIAITVRTVAGEAAARRALPALVLAPYAVWVATSMDALFLAAGAWATALLAIAATLARPASARGDSGPEGGARMSGAPAAGARALSSACALAGGLVLGALPYLSYGLLPLLAVPVVVALLLRPPRQLVIVVIAAVAVVVTAFTRAGFWWPDGVQATARAWASHAGGPDRPYAYFLLSNIAVLAVMVGPAVATVLVPAVRDGMGLLRGLGGGLIADLRRTVRLRTRFRPAVPASPGTSDHRSPDLGPPDPEPGGRRAPMPAALGAVVVAAMIGVAALDLSGVTRGEVERIWLPYAAWILAVTAYHRSPSRGRLAAQAALGLAVQAFVGSPW
jgi:hypothetical protein